MLLQDRLKLGRAFSTGIHSTEEEEKVLERLPLVLVWMLREASGGRMKQQPTCSSQLSSDSPTALVSYAALPHSDWGGTHLAVALFNLGMTTPPLNSSSLNPPLATAPSAPFACRIEPCAHTALWRAAVSNEEARRMKVGIKMSAVARRERESSLGGS
jgi:hypothetical protein